MSEMPKWMREADSALVLDMFAKVKKLSSAEMKAVDSLQRRLEHKLRYDRPFVLVAPKDGTWTLLQFLAAKSRASGLLVDEDETAQSISVVAGGVH